METITLQNQRKSKRVPVNFTATATYARHRIRVRIENISRDGICLQSPCYMNVHSIFGLAMKLPGSDETIGMYMTTSFIEKAGNCYGVGAHISGIATEARLKWEGYYERMRQHCSASSNEVVRIRHYRVALVYNPLPGPSVHALQEAGIELVEANSTADIARITERGDTDLLVAELNSNCIEMLANFRKQSRRRLPTRLLLLAPHNRPQDFTLGLGLGADRVIGVPCSREMIVEQIVQMLYQASQLRISRDVQPIDASALEDGMSSGYHTVKPPAERSSISTTLISALRWLLRTDPAPKPAAQPA